MAQRDPVPGRLEKPSKLEKGNRPDEMVAIARHPLVAEVRRALFGPCGIVPGERVIVAVSGGADSMAMMLCMAAIACRSRRSGGIRPIVVHVDHGLRPDSAADARFVVRQAQRLGLPHEASSVDVRGWLRRRGGNAEAVARELRYAALADAARRHHASAVATAHHAEDQFETMLMNLCRGCGAEALCGMPWTRVLAGASIVRPLLGSSRAACRDLCRSARRRWRSDATNSDITRARARLRADVLPVLESMWPGCAVRAAAAADRLRAALAAEHDFDPAPTAIDRTESTRTPSPSVAPVPPATVARSRRVRRSRT